VRPPLRQVMASGWGGAFGGTCVCSPLRRRLLLPRLPRQYRCSLPIGFKPCARRATRLMLRERGVRHQQLCMPAPATCRPAHQYCQKVSVGVRGRRRRTDERVAERKAGDSRVRCVGALRRGMGEVHEVGRPPWLSA